MPFGKPAFACWVTLLASTLNSRAAVAADAKPVASDDAARLQKVEQALRDAGLLPASQEARDAEIASLREQIKKLEDQHRNLEDAVRHGLEAESVKPVLAALEKKASDARQRIATLEAASAGAAEPVTPSRLPERLNALEAAVQGLQAAKTSAPASTPAAAVATPNSAPAATPAPAAKDSKPSGTAGWKDGFFIESADGAYSLKPSGFVDLKFAYAGLADKDDEFAFSIPYARLAFKGTLFTKAFKYNFTTDFPKGNAQLTYFFGDYTFVPDFFAVRAGQQKRPFSRLYIGPSEKSQFVSSSATVKAFGDATDIGIVFHNGLPRFEYALGLFNGTTSKSNFAGAAVVDPMTGKGTVTSGAFSNVPQRFQPAVVARVAANYGKIEGYTEADFEGGPLRASLGLASFTAFDLDQDDKSSLRGTVDGLIKYQGLAVNAAGFIGSKQNGKHFRNREHEASGFVLQAGYLVTPHVEPVARYALVSPNGPDNDTHELTGGMNVYFYKHSLKWQNDVTASIRPGAEKTITDYLYESQLQLMF
jgi:hypothetical protein